LHTIRQVISLNRPSQPLWTLKNTGRIRHCYYGASCPYCVFESCKGF